MKTNTITIVVPCYNEAETLDLFMAEILRTQEKIPEVFLEVLMVNDGSKDQTLEVMKRLAKMYPDRVFYLSFTRNFGKEAGIIAGLDHARGEWVALMDADLQDPPHLLVEMHRMITEEGYDTVATRRTTREGEPLIRSFFASMFYKINNRIADVQLEEGARDYRLMTQQVVQSVRQLPEQNRFSKGIFSWVGYNVGYIEYENVERSAGETSWSFGKLFDYALEGILSFSDAPLTLASYIGFFSFAFAVIYGIYIVVRTILFGTDSAGWPTLVVLIVGMGGLQLLCLGIVGKYIGKIYLESKNRPLYLIRESNVKVDK